MRRVPGRAQVRIRRVVWAGAGIRLLRRCHGAGNSSCPSTGSFGKSRHHTLAVRVMPNTATRWPRSNTSLWQSATTTTRATPPVRMLPGCARTPIRSARTLGIGGHYRRFRAQSFLSASAVAEITTVIAHLRDVFGEATYESLARKGETMTTAAMVTYAYDQIDQARTELKTVAK